MKASTPHGLRYVVTHCFKNKKIIIQLLNAGEPNDYYGVNKKNLLFSVSVSLYKKEQIPWWIEVLTKL